MCHGFAFDSCLGKEIVNVCERVIEKDISTSSYFWQFYIIKQDFCPKNCWAPFWPWFGPWGQTWAWLQFWDLSQSLPYWGDSARPVWPCLCPAVADVELCHWPCQSLHTLCHPSPPPTSSYPNAPSLCSELIQVRGWCHKVEFLLQQDSWLIVFLLGPRHSPSC